MDDFLGTSIQYSELQIKLLEREYAVKQEKIVEDLISSGFLDSDYDDSTETESTETELTDNEESESLEIKDDSNYTDSPIIESLDDLKMIISPKSSNDSSQLTPSQLTPSPTSSSSDLIMTSRLNSDNVNNNDEIFSVVDESIVSNSESMNDSSLQQFEDEEIYEIQEYDIITSKGIIRFMEFVFSDIKYLMILFILMVSMPILEQHQQQQRQNQMNDRFSMYGGAHYNNYKRCNGRSQRNEYLYQTSINFYMEPMIKTQSIINEEDDERDEYHDDNDNNNDNDGQCKKQQHILSFDIMTTALDLNTNKVRGARLSHHEFKINPSELISACNNNDNNDNDNNNMIMENWRMRMRNMPIPRDMPRLFLMATNGVKSPQMMRIFKETMSDSVVRGKFGRSHGLYAMIMAFVGIAGFAAANGMDELITIS